MGLDFNFLVQAARLAGIRSESLKNGFKKHARLIRRKFELCRSKLLRLFFKLQFCCRVRTHILSFV